jgi:outer membrane protein assembly factor BamA
MLVRYRKRQLPVPFLILISLLLCSDLKAQEASRDSSFRFFGVPLVFYSPDTYWGAGAAGIFTYYGNPLRSSVSFNISYTQRKQLLIGFPFQWYHPSGKWRAYGELGWYRYLYQYFGIGNTYPNRYKETYTARFPRLRATVLHNLGRRQLVGLRYAMDKYRIVEKEETGEIAEHLIPGTDGGFSSGIGPVWLFDSRDNQFFPIKGAYVEIFLLSESALTASDFKYTRFSFDGAKYLKVWRNKVLVLHSNLVLIWGEAPFFLLPQIGGPRRLRGYPDGKFRDSRMLLLDTEFRFPLIWRFKGVIFSGLGTVFNHLNEKVVWRPNIGGGLRYEFDRKQRLHLRLDYGIGNGSSGFYLTVGEAF